MAVVTDLVNVQSTAAPQPGKSKESVTVYVPQIGSSAKPLLSLKSACHRSVFPNPLKTSSFPELDGESKSSASSYRELNSKKFLYMWVGSRLFQLRSVCVSKAAEVLSFLTLLIRTLSLEMVKAGTVILLHCGVGVVVGEAVAVGVADGVTVGDGVKVGVDVGVAVAVPVGAKGLIGTPITRAVRNCSTIPVRCARSWRSGQN